MCVMLIHFGACMASELLPARATCGVIHYRPHFYRTRCGSMWSNASDVLRRHFLPLCTRGVDCVRHVFGDQVSETAVVSSVVRERWRALCCFRACTRDSKECLIGSILSPNTQESYDQLRSSALADAGESYEQLQPSALADAGYVEVNAG